MTLFLSRSYIERKNTILTTGGAYNRIRFDHHRRVISAVFTSQGPHGHFSLASDLRKSTTQPAYFGSPFTYLLLHYLPEKEMNTFEQYLLEAMDIVSAWDLPDEDIADAVNSQARLMAGQYDSYEDSPESVSCH